VLIVWLVLLGLAAAATVLLLRLLDSPAQSSIVQLPLVPASSVVRCPWGGVLPVHFAPVLGDGDELPGSPGPSGGGSEPAPAPLLVLPESVTLCWRPANGSSYWLEHTDWWGGGPHDKAERAAAEGGPGAHPGRLSSLGPWVSAPAGNSTHATVRHLLPATTVAFRVRVSGTSPDGTPLNETSPAVNHTLPPRGSCGNPSDVGRFRATYDRFQSTVQECLGLCALDPHPTTCAGKCMRESLGLTAACADCWVGLGQCTLGKCPLCILAPTGADCKACSKGKCFPATVACSGIPMWRFPGI